MLQMFHHMPCTTATKTVRNLLLRHGEQSSMIPKDFLQNFAQLLNQLNLVERSIGNGNLRVKKWAMKSWDLWNTANM